MNTECDHGDGDYEVREALAEVGYDVLNRVPLLGTLIKTAIRLHKHTQNKRLAIFAETIIKGLPPDPSLIEDLEGREGESFRQILQSLLTDREENKAAIYAFIYIFLVKNRLFEQNHPLAMFIVEATHSLTLYDIELIKEIDTVLQEKRSADEMENYFTHLEYTRTPNDRSGFDWRRRISVQNLIKWGMLAKVQPQTPLWTTEHFDILAPIVHGLDEDREPLVNEQ